MATRLVRSSTTAALGVTAALFLAACTSTPADEGAAASSSAPTSVASSDSGVTAAAQPYTGVDPSAATSAPGDSSGSAAASSPAATTAPAPATTEVPQPGGPGNITDTVAEGTVVSAAPVALDATSDSGTGVGVALSGIEATTTEAELPGEVAGPGVKVTVTVTNDSAAAVDLGNVVVDLQDSAGTPAIPMTVGASPFTGSVASGATATATYVFSVPSSYTNPATITVTYAAGAPVAVFTGDAR